MQATTYRPKGILATATRGGLGLFQRLRGWLRGIPKLSALALLVIAVCALFAEFLVPHDPLTNNLRIAELPPMAPASDGGLPYVFGTDRFGRDIFSRVILGARVSAIVSLAAVALAGSAGVLLGLISGYAGGKLDAFVMGFTDTWLAIPTILLALILIYLLSPSLGVVIAVIAVTIWPSYTRVVRSEVLTIKERDFVQLARVAGASPERILLRHIFPQTINTIIILATLQVGTVMLFEAALSFLGLGVQPPTPSWGRMVSDGKPFLATAWWMALFPGLAIMATVLSLNLLGDWLRDRLDPVRRQAV